MLRNNLQSCCKGLLIGLFILTCGCGKPEIRNLGSKGRNIICFGDSITFGYGAGPGEDFPTALSRMVSMPVINAGIDGDTSAEALKRLDADVLSKQPYLVLVEFAGNDFLRKVPMEDTLSNMNKIIERIQSAGVMVAIVDVSAGLFLREYRVFYSDLARRKHAIFISAVLSGIITNPSMKSDFFHPNASGYKLIAERILKEIKPYLK